MEGVNHHKAVEMIRDSPPVVQLLVTQTQTQLPPGLSDSDSIMSINTAHMEALMADTYPVSDSEPDRFSYAPANGTFMNGKAERSPSPADSSMLDIENILPPEALTHDYIQNHMNQPAIKSASHVDGKYFSCFN